MKKKMMMDEKEMPKDADMMSESEEKVGKAIDKNYKGKMKSMVKKSVSKYYKSKKNR